MPSDARQSMQRQLLRDNEGRCCLWFLVCAVAVSTPFASFAIPLYVCRYIQTHIGDERHDLPPGSLYHSFPRLAQEMSETVFLGTSYERATPVDTFCGRFAPVVLSARPPRHYRDGHLSWFPWLLSMIAALWVLDLSYGLTFGLLPNSMVRRRAMAAQKRD